MSFKLKNIILVQSSFYALNCGTCCFAAETKTSNALNAPHSTLSALSNAGAAAPGDASMVDANPALLAAFKKEYYFFSGVAWQNEFESFEIGAFDSTTSSLAASLKVRQTIPNGIAKDRSFQLGLGYQIPQIQNLSIGLSGEYQQLSLIETWSSNQKNFNLGTGVLYQINFNDSSPLFLGLSSRKIFDRESATTFDFGLSKNVLNGFYTLSADTLLNSKNGLQSLVSGMSITINKFFDIKGSIGYNPKMNEFFWGSGIFFNGPVLRVYYTLVKPDSSDKTLRQTAGVHLALSF